MTKELVEVFVELLPPDGVRTDDDVKAMLATFHRQVQALGYAVHDEREAIMLALEALKLHTLTDKVSPDEARRIVRVSAAVYSFERRDP